MKNSIFAKILILVLCLSLVLCGCGKDTTDNDTDPTEAPTVNENPDPTKGSDKDPNKDPDDDSSATGLGSVLENIFGDDVDTDDLLSALECGKVTITVGDMLTNVMYVDVANLKFVDQLNMNVDGSEVNAQIYLNQHDLVVALPEILPDTYGISFDTLATDLPTSAIWSLMGTTYEDFMDQLAAEMDGVLEIVNKLEGVVDEAEECMDSLMTAFEDALKNVEQTTTNGQANIRGELVDAKIVSYTVDSEAMEKMVKTMLTWCEDNAANIAEILQQLEISETEINENSIIDAMTEAQTQVGAFFENADLEAVLSLNLNPKTDALMSIDGSFSGTVDGEEGGFLLNLTLGENPAESDQYSFSILDTRNNGFSIDLVRQVENTKTTYTLVASSISSAAATEMLIASASYDTASNEYELTLSVDGDTASINGTCKVTDETFEFSVDTLNINGEETALNIKLVAESISSSEIPSTPKYTNLLKMSEAELTELLEKFQGEDEEDLKEDISFSETLPETY